MWHPKRSDEEERNAKIFYVSLVLFLLILGTMLAKSETKVDYSRQTNKYSFMENLSIGYAQRNNIDEYSLGLSSYYTPDVLKYSLTAKADYDYQETVSKFLFSTYNYDKTLESEYLRIGAGVGYVPPTMSNLNKIPFRLKYSFAFILETGKGLFASQRVKYEGFYNKYGFKVISNATGYSDDFSLKLTNKINGNVSLFYNYKYYRVGSKTDYSDSTGIQVKF